MTTPSSIVTSVITLLANDAELATMLPDGIYFHAGPPSLNQFGLVLVVDGAFDAIFGGGGIYLLQVIAKAVIRSGDVMPAEDAAGRIHAVLTGARDVFYGGGFALEGGRLMAIVPMIPVAYSEPVEGDLDVYWQHRGSQYEISISA